MGDRDGATGPPRERPRFGRGLPLPLAAGPGTNPITPGRHICPTESRQSPKTGAGQQSCGRRGLLMQRCRRAPSRGASAALGSGRRRSRGRAGPHDPDRGQALVRSGVGEQTNAIARPADARRAYRRKQGSRTSIQVRGSTDAAPIRDRSRRSPRSRSPSRSDLGDCGPEPSLPAMVCEGRASLRSTPASAPALAAVGRGVLVEHRDRPTQAVSNRLGTRG
jgi:hypothetical protein